MFRKILNYYTSESTRQRLRQNIKSTTKFQGKQNNLGLTLNNKNINKNILLLFIAVTDDVS